MPQSHQAVAPRNRTRPKSAIADFRPIVARLPSITLPSASRLHESRSAGPSRLQVPHAFRVLGIHQCVDELLGVIALLDQQSKDTENRGPRRDEECQPQRPGSAQEDDLIGLIKEAGDPTGHASEDRQLVEADNQISEIRLTKRKKRTNVSKSVGGSYYLK